MKVIAFDLGTGGVKASLYDEALDTLGKVFIEYETLFPGPSFHEQRPKDWWQGVVRCCRSLLEETAVRKEEIGCVALSGHSLVNVPVDKNGNCLLDAVPIWSDTRALNEADEFFQKVNKDEWYMTTGNGFPSACYSIFKLMWMKKHEPDVFRKTYKVLGSKDYINFKLTGKMATDFSYISGCGAYALKQKKLKEEYLETAGLPGDIFPDIVTSHTIIGYVTREAAQLTGLKEGTAVACGGVDNACMALGAAGAEEGKSYISLGTSSWIPVNSHEPILDKEKKPYVFAHLEEDMFTSAFSIFSGGNSFRWIRDAIGNETEGIKETYDELCRQAENSPPGAKGVIFNPSLAGGTSQDKSVNIQGAFLNLNLAVTRQDLIRSALEGITMNLKCSYDFMKEKVVMDEELLICGGGSKSPFWMQLFADVFDVTVIKSSIDQDAASLGAAAAAARSLGIIKDYSFIKHLHRIEKSYIPNAEHVRIYEKQLEIFKHASKVLADFGDYMHNAL
ncbi:xylulokinase [Anaerocolumna xylanovorans]|uniref:Xylulokinase n=1 Tax=Anaerocolumna xylanovorans DSM 12503 TaxID=1121345 RepID=A0A1M7XWJ1_9FIRM|nr:FGGY family carbohydrate kinase [Anaerocolumna xylanovorans]SHO43021.1 xylulokinase [Anaerocolumna xylanovorans DSM 12503]